MSDLKVLLRKHYESAVRPIDVERLYDQLASGTSSRLRWQRPMFALAAALLVLIVIGGVALLRPGVEQDVGDEVTTTTALRTTTTTTRTTTTTSPATSDTTGTSFPTVGVVLARVEVPGFEAVAPSGAPSDEIGVRDVAFGSGIFVAVGSVRSEQSMDAAIWTSPDGQAWTRVPHDPDLFSGASGMTISAVTWGDEGFVAVGPDLDASGVIWRSVDGEVWEVARNDLAGASSVTYGAHGYVVTGGGEVWTSPDGQEWSRSPGGDFGVYGMPNECCAGVNDIVYGRDGYVAAGFDDFGGWAEKAAVWYSPDALTWTRVDHDDALFGPKADEEVWFEVFGIASGNGRYVAVGSAEPESAAAVWISTSGSSWQLLTLGADVCLNDVTYGPSGFLAVGRDKDSDASAFWFSTDGADWNRVPHNEDLFGGPGTQTARHVSHGSDRYVIIGTESERDGPAQPLVWIIPNAG